MTTKQPLGISTVTNIKTSQPNHKYDDKLKKIQLEAIDERRRRAEAEGTSQGWKMELHQSQKQIEDLMQDLEKAKGKIIRREETIKSLEIRNKESNQAPDSEFNMKLEDLVEKHRSSKLKYQAQLANLQTENNTLQETLSQQIQETINLKGKIESNDRDKMQLLEQINTLKRETDLGLKRETRDYENEKTEWKIEKHRLERNVASLISEVEHLKASIERNDHRAERNIHKEDDLRKANRILEKENASLREKVIRLTEVEEENEILENLVSACSIQYRILYKNTTSKARYRELETKYITAHTNSLEYKNRVKRLEAKLSFQQYENTDLSDQLRAHKREVNMLSESLASVLKDKQDLRKDISSHVKDFVRGEVIKPLRTLPILPAIELAVDHAELANCHLRTQLVDIEDQHFDLLSKYETTKEILASNVQSLSDLQQSFAELRTSHQGLEAAHAPCQPMINNLQNLLAASESQVVQLTGDLSSAVQDAKKCTNQSKEDREALKRANETVMRSKMAEEALDEEVKHLQEAYVSAAAYEELYADLQEKYEILECRERVAVEEAEKLGLENAELAGHQNEYQRINYVEGVRREMVLLKQELASTRHLLNLSNDKILILENDIQAYTSIEPTHLRSSINGLHSSRLRVSRRQPENGRLTVSRSQGRCVSGPIGR
ncbi:uncharacterized protein I206_106206 [Kwoniella pini CBS 10737]|uniref:Hyaluronan-mediated motility receptor C-terminal domain-containing protein n=1 Tax=Kwoniella pini CBS 10737 TaxID=1296096 RepID=A0A1B9I1C5_9TREE|nr:uncharacterized protein I206_05030 [Kwoniella pini CBS 10737]OCF49339.1 hypothetical protein I206_05030 [Kwoniella pini CBS 10737]